MDNPFEQQFDPSYFAGQATESGRRRRSSTASENSATSGQYSPELESQFILSMGNTPVVENPPQQPLARPGAITIGGIDGLAPSDQWRTWAKNKNKKDPPRPPNRSTVSDNYTNNISGSRPIAIELPSRRRVNTAPDWNKKPPEHLSARGDVLGGFFPDHGDKQVQFYQPHPFHEDTQRAREDSIVQAVADCNKAPEEREQDAAEVVPMSNPSEPTLLGVLDGVSTQLSAHGSEDAPSTNTIAAYNPLGDHVSPIPTGKYYPTNWENRKRAKGKLIAERPLSSPSATIQAGSEMPKYRLIHPSPPALLDQSHTPKTRLQQYQREMVMHASFAASTLARGKGKATAVATKDSCNASSSSLDLVAMAHIQLGKHRPVSPRLHPLGSPGPVTPMDLESNKADGYIDARPVGPDSDREVEEIANALRAEEERRKREGASSPMGQVKM